MKYTPLGFKKPEMTDYVDIGDLNFNADLYDSTIGAIITMLDAINGVVI